MSQYKGYLLDTCTLLYWAKGELDTCLQKTLGNSQIPVYISSVSHWEMAIKIEKLKISPEEQKNLKEILDQQTTEIPLGSLSANLLQELPKIHRDPFDRMLICQSRLYKLEFITIDKKILKYQDQVDQFQCYDGKIISTITSKVKR